jgi:hypothetical protein
MDSLGAKKDVYTGVRCISSGVLLGRMAAGLASFERNLGSKQSWSPGYAAHFGAESAYKAAKFIEKIQTTARPHLKIFTAKMEPYKDYNSGYLNKEKASEDVVVAKRELAAIAQLVAKTCGKRRPAEGEGAALVEMKNVKREQAPRPPKNIPMELPVLAPEEPAQESPSVWPVLAGVLMIIGATFFVR